MPSMKAQDPSPQQLHKKLHVAMYACAAALGRQKQEYSQGLLAILANVWALG